MAFVDQIFHAFLPDRKENAELHNLVKLYQLHRHSRTCRKYKNELCRFKFGTFVSLSLKKKNSSCGAFAREYARNNQGFGLAQKKWNT